SYSDYGKLSGRSVDDMIAGLRVEVAPFKEDPMDFVLWKPSTDDLPGWESPWGRGRPGWHIECSAMSHALLGKSFDIHAGGNDLMFPHHENEIAQSRCAFPDGDFAHYWLHNEMLQVEGKKMSKSLGNFFTVRDLLDQGYTGEVIRYVFLQTHYRKPMDWTQAKAQDALKELGKWHRLIGDTAPGEVPDALLTALSDDLNTPGAIAVLRQLADAGDTAALKAGLDLMGLRTLDDLASDRIRDSEKEALSALADRFTQIRLDAMQSKDFSEVDRLKSALIAAGVEVRMSKDGVELLPAEGFDPKALNSI
ncbi:MAG: class I tRNA ligase family protein, partial [Pseudomonadota bacterium]